MSTSSPLIVIACGGTGGHIYPGIAIGKQLEQQGYRVHFIGSDNRMEKTKIPAAGMAFSGLPVYPLNKKRPLYTLGVLRRSLQMGLAELDRLCPIAVVGLGSYITVPTIVAARLRKIPIFLVETNVHPGKANLFLARFATCVSLAYAQSARYFGNTPTAVGGSPIRADFQFYPRSEGAEALGVNPALLTLSIVGGSQGAQIFNHKIAAELSTLLKLPDLQIVHVCGENHYAAMKEQCRDYLDHPRFHLRPYIDNMPALLACTDLAVSRAGASTLAEFAACKVPAILVPGTFGGGHQRDNAHAVAEAGAGICLEEAQFREQPLFPLIRDVMRDTEQRRQMQENCSKLNPIDAAHTIAQLVIDTTTQRRKEAPAC
jgi:UDP-N-acetylglucosamine--N-acetylmuramyl-(pentapeptide) pyrophosphoryl-undecaprenol N-acetylglucosamine transferase